MSNTQNPLLDEYINLKAKEFENNVDEWVHALRLIYQAARKEGFTAKQSMQIVEMQWKQSDDWKFKMKILEKK